VKTRLRPALALAVAALGGCAAFFLSLPWGEPCATHGYAGGPCPIVLSATQHNLRNAAFVLICLAVGFGAGALSRSYRLLVGALSVPLAGFLGAVLARVVYDIDTPLFNFDIPNADVMTIMYVGGLLLLGAIGASASMVRRPSSTPSFKPRPPSGS